MEFLFTGEKLFSLQPIYFLPQTHIGKKDVEGHILNVTSVHLLRVEMKGEIEHLLLTFYISFLFDFFPKNHILFCKKKKKKNSEN